MNESILCKKNLRQKCCRKNFVEQVWAYPEPQQQLLLLRVTFDLRRKLRALVNHLKSLKDFLTTAKWVCRCKLTTQHQFAFFSLSLSLFPLSVVPYIQRYLYHVLPISRSTFILPISSTTYIWYYLYLALCTSCATFSSTTYVGLPISCATYIFCYLYLALSISTTTYIFCYVHLVLPISSTTYI